MVKLILLALDGLSWNLIEELIADNKLKNMNQLINSGASAIMRADGFLSSPKIFCSIFTGKTSENHGIKDFYAEDNDLRSDQIWDILDNEGFKLGIYRPISALAAKKVDGFFIPSPFISDVITYPQNLTFIREIDKKARTEKYSLNFLINFFLKLIKFRFPIKYLISIAKRGLLLSNKGDLKSRMYLLKEIELIIHANIYYRLLKKFNPHFSVFFDYSCDTLGHVYWRDKGDVFSNYSDVLPKIYSRIDKFIGKISKFAKKNNYHLIICSDHGFKIKEKKLLKNYRTINILYLLKELKFYNDIYGIQLRERVVFRERPKSSKALEEFKKSIEYIRSEDKKLFEIRAYEKKLIVKANNITEDIKNKKAELLDGRILGLEKIIDFNPPLSGTHCENNGVFLSNGPNIKEGINIGDIKPYDITPTILKLFNLSIPNGVEGKVLKEIFKIKP